MSKENGYKRIFAELRDRINNGVYPAGTMLPSERKLCEEWQVERTTIRRALDILASEEFIIKKTGVGSVVNDKSNNDAPMISFIASSPTLQSSGGLGAHHFLTPVYNALASLLSDSGFRSVSMMFAGARRMESFESVLKTSRGLILADNVPHEFLKAAKDSGIPCVLMSERALGFRSVLCDNDSGLSQAVGHLASLGHRNIAYLGGDRVYLNSFERRDGFRRAMFTYGLDEPRPVMALCGWGIQDGYETMKKILTEHPEITAVCTANDYVAFGACCAAIDSGRRVPEDFSVIGFGDTVDEQTSKIELTTVRVPHERFANELYRSLMLELERPFENPASVLVEAELVIRGSCAKVGDREI